MRNVASSEIDSLQNQQGKILIMMTIVTAILPLLLPPPPLLLLLIIKITIINNSKYEKWKFITTHEERKLFCMQPEQLCPVSKRRLAAVDLETRSHISLASAQKETNAAARDIPCRFRKAVFFQLWKLGKLPLAEFQKGACCCGLWIASCCTVWFEEIPQKRLPEEVPRKGNRLPLFDR